MDQIERAFALFNQRKGLSATSRIDALLNIQELEDPRALPFLLHVAADTDELPEVRFHVIRTMRIRELTADARVLVARVVGTMLVSDPNSGVRAQCALTLAEFTDVEGVTPMLGIVALDDKQSLDLRYSAFTSLERAGPRPECVSILRQLSVDGTFGQSARRLLSMWDLQ